MISPLAPVYRAVELRKDGKKWVETVPWTAEDCYTLTGLADYIDKNCKGERYSMYSVHKKIGGEEKKVFVCLYDRKNHS